VGLHKAHAGRKVDPQHMLTAQQPQQSEGHTRPIEAARNQSSRHENRSTKLRYAQKVRCASIAALRNKGARHRTGTHSHAIAQTCQAA
jgi:hypothetical protein